MSRYQTRLVICSVAALALLLVSAFGMLWFTLRIEGLELSGMNIDHANVTIRSISMCTSEGACTTFPLSKVPGFYPTMSTAAFWTTLVLSVIVAYQAGSRVLRGVAGEGIARVGYLVGLVCFVAAGLAGFVFAPEAGSNGTLALHVTRSFGPLMTLAGAILAMIAIRIAGADEMLVADAPRATGRLPPTPLATKQITPPPPQEPRKRTPSSIPLDVALESGPAEHPLHGKLKYVAATVDVSRAGIDARREDGVSKLVMWTDVVGVVARRLPAEAPYDGETFVDLVSSAGSTLRLVAWTRWNGDEVAGEGEDRARAIVQLVATRCPAAQLDAATRTFVGGRGHAAQLPDATTLAQHDERLA